MHGRALKRILFACVSVAASGALNAQRWGTRPGGAALPELASPDAPAVVLFFVASDCPISNRTFPEMARLREEFSPRGVRFWYVYPNTTEQPAGIIAHQRTFDHEGEALQDTGGSLVRLSHAIVTPEVAVLVHSPNGWHSVYTGRVDNRYIRLGQERPTATEHYGQDAIAAVLGGRIPRPATGTPVGCAIMDSKSR